ncbi:hypothetical protein PybrP1_006158, partial [[Pythium] brassicae (nom. inval.)]
MVNVFQHQATARIQPKAIAVASNIAPPPAKVQPQLQSQPQSQPPLQSQPQSAPTTLAITGKAPSYRAAENPKGPKAHNDEATKKFEPGKWDIWMLGITIVIGGQYFSWNAG